MGQVVKPVLEKQVFLLTWKRKILEELQHQPQPY